MSIIEKAAKRFEQVKGEITRPQAQVNKVQRLFRVNRAQRLLMSTTPVIPTDQRLRKPTSILPDYISWA
ncbi:MAG: hypothetical protein IPP36_10765 [Nitrosomonadales bacterium]|nr:hypothetical protein [Nitrosomonadales bacterium]